VYGLRREKKERENPIIYTLISTLSITHNAVLNVVLIAFTKMVCATRMKGKFSAICVVSVVSVFRITHIRIVRQKRSVKYAS
jgi:hypothetical protein